LTGSRLFERKIEVKSVMNDNRLRHIDSVYARQQVIRSSRTSRCSSELDCEICEKREIFSHD